MSETITKNEYIWEAWDYSVDSLPIGLGYFTDKNKCDEFVRKNKLAGSRQVTLWTSNGNYYNIPYIRQVYVNLPEKQTILNKLSDVEKHVLGLK